MTDIHIVTGRRAHLAVTALAALLLVALAGSSFAQQAPAPAPAKAPTIARAPAPQTDPTSGPEMFKAYCAVCHGTTAKGDGPAAKALVKPPADLTKLSAKNGGKFPDGLFQDAIVHGPASHGTSEMPIWGPVFDALNNKAVTAMRIGNLSQYVQSLQTK